MDSLHHTGKALDVYDLLFGKDEKSSSPMSQQMISYALKQIKRETSCSSGNFCGVVASQASRPQAMTKLIVSGGTSNARGLKAQMAYLRKDDTVKLEMSDMYMGAVLDEDNESDFTASWGLDDRERSDVSKTAHFVVSFPEGTDRTAAYESGRAWASKLFASGDYGDIYDYYTAFHIDRAHPHMHVVVNRRGMCNGLWLKVSKRGAINYDEMRFVQVEVAAENGIELAATPRSFRGIVDEPYSKYEVFRARQEGREPVPPIGTEFSRRTKELVYNIFMAKAHAEAEILSEHYPDLANKMFATIDIIDSHNAIKAEGPKRIDGPFIITKNEVAEMNHILEGHRNKIDENFEELDRRVVSLPDSVEKIQIIKGIAAIRKEAASFMPEIAQSIRPNSDQEYRGIESYDQYTSEIEKLATEKIRELASEAGLDRGIFAARFEGNVPVPSTIAEQWQDQDVKVIETRLVEGQKLSPDEAHEQAVKRLEGLHEEITEVLVEARSQIKEYESDRRDLVELLNSEAAHSPQEYHALLVPVLTESQRDELDHGDYTALSEIYDDAEDQIRLAQQYLDAEIALAQMDANLQKRTEELSMARDQLPGRENHQQNAHESHYHDQESNNDDEGLGR